MVKVALVVSIIALAVCLLTALHGVLSDGLKGLKQRSKPISISFLIYIVCLCSSRINPLTMRCLYRPPLADVLALYFALLFCFWLD